jgi:hypothetical protein
LSHQTIATFADYFQDTLDKYNGNNEQEVYAYARKIGFFHSPIPDPVNFVLRILSVEEKNLIRDVLTPVEQKVHKAHLLSVQDDADDDSCVVLKLRRYELKLTNMSFTHKLHLIALDNLRLYPSMLGPDQPDQRRVQYIIIACRQEL